MNVWFLFFFVLHNVEETKVDVAKEHIAIQHANIINLSINLILFLQNAR